MLTDTGQQRAITDAADRLSEVASKIAQASAPSSSGISSDQLKLGILENCKQCQGKGGALYLLGEKVDKLVEAMGESAGARRVNAIWMGAAIVLAAALLGAFANYKFGQLHDVQGELIKQLKATHSLREPTAPAKTGVALEPTGLLISPALAGN